MNPNNVIFKNTENQNDQNPEDFEIDDNSYNTQNFENDSGDINNETQFPNNADTGWPNFNNLFI